MANWNDVVVSPETPLTDSIVKIDASALQVALVLNGNGTLAGVVTDGDVRRAILRGQGLQVPVAEVMNCNPTTVSAFTPRDEMLALMRRKGFHHLPLVDEAGRVVGLVTLDELIGAAVRSNWVVLMAGGLGTRLQPLTNECPKPMLKVGNKPLLETILENFIEYGFCRFYISVNYMADAVKSYFGDGSRWGVDIRYLHEDQRLGTAGALSLLPGKPTEALLVMNGDLLTKVNFRQLLDFHCEQRARATMCIREYGVQVPYGVVKIDAHCITGIDEKPIQRFFVNAGIYALEPEALDLIPSNTYFDMPTLFEKLIELKKETAAFPVREYWLDIGHLADYNQAIGEYRDILF
jgi:dTDP-glucose pyrophosphorylase